MFRIRSSAAPLFVVALLGVAATGAFATPGSELRSLQGTASPSPIEKVHEGYGGMHQGCARHKSNLPDFAGYPDCHWHHYNDVKNRWEIRRRLLDGTPCPANDACSYEPSRSGH